MEEVYLECLDELMNLSDKQLQMLTWFRSNAASLADAYEGAVRLLQDKDFPGRIPFLAHAVRDIADRLVYALDPRLDGKRVQYENELDVIAKEWPNLQTILEENAVPEIDNSVRIESKLASRIDRLVEAHRERRKRPSNYELLFRFLMRYEPTLGEVNERLVSDFKENRNWFMNLTHLRKDAAPSVDESELQSRFNAFDGMLYSFVGNFFTQVAELDEILQETNN